jgi:ABC-type protease/lipase transport system fused ATPase/permease subunit
MEQVVTQWRHLVAFMKALDRLHPVMRAVLHHHTTMAFKMASDGGTFVHCCRLFCLIKRS